MNKTGEVRLSGKLWLAGADSLCGAVCGLVTGGGMTYMYTRWMGFDTDLAALVWLIFGIWNAVNDPLFGFISDHTKSKIGRRIPYIRYGAPFYALTFIVMWIPYLFGKSQGALFVQMLAMLFIFDTLYTAIASALYVMPYEMTTDNNVRGSIFIWKIVFGVVSLAAPMVIMPMIEPNPGESLTTFMMVVVAIGLLAGIVIFTSTFFYHELNYVKEEEQPGFGKCLVECFTNKAFLIFEVLSFTTQYINTSLSQGILYYFNENGYSMVPCILAVLVGAVFGVILFRYMSEHVGLKKALILLCLEFGIGCLMMAFFGRIYPLAVFCFGLAGIGYAGCMFVVPLMNGDVIDFDETRTGLRREGMYAGVNSFITKPAVSIAQAAFLKIWTMLDYDPSLHQGLQSEAAKSGLMIAWMLIPGILLLVSGFSILFYPLDGEGWKETKRKIAEKHAEKEAKFKQNVEN